MWANEDVADFLDWLHSWNLALPEDRRVGFYGLDVYSLWDSLERIRGWLRVHAPEALGAAETAWRCFSPFDGDPQRYAWATRIVPQSCEPEVVHLLATVLRRTHADGAGAFDALQNAAVAVGAERYYRAMVRADRSSWNIRDIHMADTIARIDRFHGAGSKGVIWEHNTHVGDARGTTMTDEGLVNVGQLLRERYGDSACLIGFASHRGSVLAASQWGSPDERMPLEEAIAGSHEDLLHRGVGEPGVVVWDAGLQGQWLRSWRGHRAIGVVFDPARQAHNYVPTRMGRRYDALVWFEETRALVPLHHEVKPDEFELETEPTGY
jgi:erythromycin esterase-like protein